MHVVYVVCIRCECTHVYNLQFYYSESNKIELMHLHIISLRPLKLNQGMCYKLYKSKCKLNDYLFHFTFASHTAKHYQTELQLILRFNIQSELKKKYFLVWRCNGVVPFLQLPTTNLILKGGVVCTAHQILVSQWNFGRFVQ